MKEYILKICIDNTFVPAALFLLDEDLQEGSLSYLPSYLNLDKAFPFDPINLKLSRQQYTTRNNKGYFGFLNDMLPHGWNRKMIELDGQEVILERNIALSNIIKLENYTPQKSYINIDKEPDKLQQYQETIKKIEHGEAVERQELFSSFGGVRPKILVKHNNKLWIAKFESKHDKYNNPSVEFAMIKLAEQCGIDTPDVKLLTVDSKKIFLTEHFALNSIVLSGGTILNMDWYGEERYYDYRNLYEKIKSPEIFKRIVFNVFTKNMDDHPWNHSFLYNGKTLKMSPLYDMMPIRDNECILHGDFGDFESEGTMENLLSSLKYFNEEKETIFRMKAVIQNWYKLFTELKVSKKDIEFIENAFIKPEKSL